jgi:hypothetical protein
VLGVKDSHGLDVTLVHTAMACLGPPPLVALLASELEYSNSTVHAAREDRLAVGAADEIETVRVVAIHALRQGICPPIPKLDLSVRVA